MVNPLVDNLAVRPWTPTGRSDGLQFTDAIARHPNVFGNPGSAGSPPATTRRRRPAYGIVTDEGLLGPNHYLAVAIEYLYAPPSWPAGIAVGKTVVSSSIIDRVVAVGRQLR